MVQAHVSSQQQVKAALHSLIAQHSIPESSGQPSIYTCSSTVVKVVSSENKVRNATSAAHQLETALNHLHDHASNPLTFAHCSIQQFTQQHMLNTITTVWEFITTRSLHQYWCRLLDHYCLGICFSAQVYTLTSSPYCNNLVNTQIALYVKSLMLAV